MRGAARAWVVLLAYSGLAAAQPISGGTGSGTPEALLWLLTPHSQASVLRERHEPLRRHLEQALGVPIRMEVAPSYEVMTELLVDGRAALAELSPYAYVRAQTEGVKVYPLANAIAEGAPTGAGYVVVRSDSKIRDLEDLRGGSFAFVDPASTTGFLYPMKLLLDRRHIPESFLARTEFLGNHEAALLAVHQGRFDAAATHQGAMQSLERRRGVSPRAFRIIAKTPRSPRDLLCATDRLSPQQREHVRALLLGLSVRTAEGRRVLGPLGFNGFIPADERLYDRVREAARQVLRHQKAP